MAVAVAEPSTSVDFVTEAVLANYRARVEPAVEVSLAELVDAPRAVGALRGVMSPTSHLIEVVLDDESPLHELAEVAWHLERDGLHLNVLIALSRLGEAHSELRGTPCTLQGWWFNDDDVHFAGFERP